MRHENELVSKSLYEKFSLIENQNEFQQKYHFVDINVKEYDFKPTDFMQEIWNYRLDLQIAYPDIFSEDKYKFWTWWLRRSKIERIIEYPIPANLLEMKMEHHKHFFNEVLNQFSFEIKELYEKAELSDADTFEWWNEIGFNQYFKQNIVDRALNDFELVSINSGNQTSEIEKIRIKYSENPKISIVIPVYNAFVHILECVKSILIYTKIDFEILLLDDCSTDPQVYDCFSKIENLIYKRNAKNLGFLQNINRNIELARGEYILILNSDTQFIDDTASKLVAELEEDLSVEIVGPKVIYPSGHLQEAGCQIDRHGNTKMIGHGRFPNDPKYTFNRFVDYVSGVCICMRKHDFLNLGKFDEDLSPAYTEDLDLCTRSQKNGRKVLYCSKSTIVHHLSISSQDMSDRYKYELSARNRLKILEKHGTFFKNKHKLKIIAFYLPQFHNVKENSFWWGEGYTEWTGCARAKPNFKGHYQPHVPADLGFYDLTDQKVFEKQAKLAKKYGIEGFCFYYYNFGDKEMLEKPLEEFLASKADTKFCLCWANEHWTKTWDGMEKNILMEQKATDEQTFISVLKKMSRFITDSRYIKIDGKPLILLYRASLFDNIADKISLWREYWRKEYNEELYICAVDSMERSGENAIPPEQLNFDAAVEFSIHGIRTRTKLSPEVRLEGVDFSGDVLDYKQAIEEICSRKHPGYKRIPSVFPSWDNTPRRGTASLVVNAVHPSLFQRFLETKKNESDLLHGDERMMFVNAWNEWGEGTHLEPDLEYGHTWLEHIAKIVREG